MPYRTAKRPDPTGQLVELRTYLDLTSAELARAQLASNDIASVVIEGASFNPLLSGAVGGHRLLVDASDLERGDAILRHTERPTDIDDTEPEGTVRCPRCELAYCSLRRPPFSVTHSLTARARWFCDRCEHVWDDPREGPAAMTPLHADDPRAVFVLSRDNTLAGVFSGGVLSLFAAFVLKIDAGPLLLAPALVGWFVGRSIARGVCSDPACRASLSVRAEACPRCHGVIAGRIERASEHWVQAAELRRELARARLEP